MRNRDYNQRHQSRQYDADWDQGRHRYRDYDPYGSSSGGYGRAGYDQDYESGHYRSAGGNRDDYYGDSRRRSGNWDRQDIYGSYHDDRDYNDPYRNERLGGGYAQGRNYDNLGTQPYSAGNWPEDRRYASRARQDYDYGDWEGMRNDDRFGNRMYENQGKWRDRRDSRGDRDWWDRTTDEVASWFGDEDAERRRRMDRAMGPNRGKGPRGYQRSDERVREDVSDRFYYDDFLDASDIEIRVNDGEVVLEGNVESKQAKRRAEDIAESIAGVKNVENHLKVNRNTPSVGSSEIRNRDRVDEDSGRIRSW